METQNLNSTQRFTQEQKTQLIQSSIDPEIKLSEEHAKGNQWWDIIFNVVALALGIVIVVCSSVAAAQISEQITRALSVVSAVLGGVLALTSGFAFEKFNFRKRQSTWAARKAALTSLRDELILDPDPKTFMDRLSEVKRWNDDTSPAQLPPPRPSIPRGQPPRGSSSAHPMAGEAVPGPR